MIFEMIFIHANTTFYKLFHDVNSTNKTNYINLSTTQDYT